MWPQLKLHKVCSHLFFVHTQDAFYGSFLTMDLYCPWSLSNETLSWATLDMKQFCKPQANLFSPYDFKAKVQSLTLVYKHCIQSLNNIGSLVNIGLSRFCLQIESCTCCLYTPPQTLNKTTFPFIYLDLFLLFLLH